MRGLMLLAGLLSVLGGRALAAEGLAHRLFVLQPGLVEASAAGASPRLQAPKGTLDFSLMERGEARDGADLLQALLLPGLDQAQHGQWLKAACFVAVEAGVLLTARQLEDRGQELDADFKAFADEHWDFSRYVGWRQHPGEFALEEGWLDRNIDAQALADVQSLEELAALFNASADDLFDASQGEGSHILPGTYNDGYSQGQDGAWEHFSVSRTQQFYEMIGKYAQFQRGWSGYGAGTQWEFASSDISVAQEAWSVGNFCAQSAHYMDMRSQSNDKLILADRILGLLVVNHLASFVDVLIQRNQQLGHHLKVQAAQLETGSGTRPGLQLGWSL